MIDKKLIYTLIKSSIGCFIVATGFVICLPGGILCILTGSIITFVSIEDYNNEKKLNK